MTLPKVDWGKLWNHGGSMFATFWIVIALYALGGYLVWAFLQLDAQFSRPLAGGVIPANVTQQIAWGIRAFSVIAGSLAIYFAAHHMKGWSRWFTGMTIFAALLLLVHAFGVSAKIMQKQYSQVSSISQVADIDVGLIDDEIAELQTERAELPALTQTAVDTYQRSIDSITNDGLDNDDEAQAFALKQREAIQARDERLGEIRTRLQELRAQKRGTRTQEVQENATESSFNDLFIFGARLSTNTWDPSLDPADTHKFIWGVAFFTFWFGFGEVLMMACFTGGYAVLKLRSVQELEASQARSEAAQKGWQTRKEKEEAEREQLKIADAGFWSLKIIKALNNNMPRRTVKGMCRTFFSNMEPAAVKVRLQRLMDARIELPKGFYQDSKGNVKRADRAIERGFLSEDHKTYLMQDHIDYILMEGEYAPKKKDDEKPKQETNGKDYSTDLTIPELGADDDADRPEA